MHEEKQHGISGEIKSAKARLTKEKLLKRWSYHGAWETLPNSIVIAFRVLVSSVT